MSAFLSVVSKCNIQRKAECQKGTLWLLFPCHSVCPLDVRNREALCALLTYGLGLDIQNVIIQCSYFVFSFLKNIARKRRGEVEK